MGVDDTRCAILHGILISLTSIPESSELFASLNIHRRRLELCFSGSPLSPSGYAYLLEFLERSRPPVSSRLHSDATVICLTVQLRSSWTEMIIRERDC